MVSTNIFGDAIPISRGIQSCSQHHTLNLYSNLNQRIIQFIILQKEIILFDSDFNQ